MRNSIDPKFNFAKVNHNFSKEKFNFAQMKFYFAQMRFYFVNVKLKFVINRKINFKDIKYISHVLYMLEKRYI